MNSIRVLTFGEQLLPDLDVTGWQRIRSVLAMTIVRRTGVDNGGLS